MPCRSRGRRRARRTSAWCRRGRDAMPCARSTTQSYLMFCPILSTLASSSSGLSAASACSDRQLRDVAARRKSRPPPAPMAERNVAGLGPAPAPARRRRSSACIGSRLVGLGVEGDAALSARPGDPVFEAPQIGDRSRSSTRSIVRLRGCSRHATAASRRWPPLALALRGRLARRRCCAPGVAVDR